MSNRKKYWANKALRTIITAIGVTLIAFLILHLTPGDPARIMLGPYATQENIQALKEKLNLNRPLPIQYLTWLKNIAQGDFGTSIRWNKPVTAVVAERIGVTLILTSSGLFISLFLGVL